MKHYFIFCFILFFASPVFAKTEALTNDHICRAVIGTIFDKKVEDVKIIRQQKDVVFISFTPEEGDKTTRFKCAVKGENIIWATETGSWRNTDIDSTISYEVKKNILYVEENHKNGSIFTKSFDIKKLMAE